MINPLFLISWVLITSAFSTPIEPIVIEINKLYDFSFPSTSTEINPETGQEHLFYIPIIGDDIVSFPFILNIPLYHRAIYIKMHKSLYFCF